MSKQWVTAVGDRFVDPAGRQLILRGLNLGGDSKVPYPDGGTEHPSDFHDHRMVSFVGRPFPIGEADEHLARIRCWGFNVLRLVVTWESVEHAGPGDYDHGYIDYIGQVCERAMSHGLAVFIDFHQDVWSRMSGGSGAPGWVFEQIGMDFTRFDAANAAHVMQHRYDYRCADAHQPDRYPDMSWASNYQMPVNGILWTAFFAGEWLTPDWKVEGRNVQRYLQDHLLGAMRVLALRLLDLPNVIGFDSLNEPGLGWLGQRLSGEPAAEVSPLRAGLVWTPLAGLKVARGLSTSLRRVLADEKCTRIVGDCVETINPLGVSIWKPGVSDPFEQAGAWRLQDGKAEVLDENFFCARDGRALHIEQDFMQPYFARVAETIRSVRESWLLFAEINPHSTASGSVFPQRMPAATVNASHWYDINLLWSRRFDPGMPANDSSKLIARYRFQLGYLKGLGERIGGGVPTLIGEFGIPCGLNDGESFRRWSAGERGADIWSAETTALALMYQVMDELLLSSTQWNYSASNRNDFRIGDRWNQEDLSVFSVDQLTTDADPYSGARAALGFCRPYVQATQGRLLYVSYDLQQQCLLLRYQAEPTVAAPTDIYIPPHFGKYLRVETGDDVTYAYHAMRNRLSLWTRQPGLIEVTVRPETPSASG